MTIMDNSALKDLVYECFTMQRGSHTTTNMSHCEVVLHSRSTSMPDMLSLLFACAFADFGTDAWDNLDVHFPCAPPDPCATLPSTWVVHFVDAMFIDCEELRPIVIPLPPIPLQTVQERSQDPPTNRRRLTYVQSPTSCDSSNRRRLYMLGARLYRSLSPETVPNISRTRASRRPPSPSLSALPSSHSRTLLTPSHQKRAGPDEPDSLSLPTKRRRLTATSYMELPSNNDLSESATRRSNRLDRSRGVMPNFHRTSVYTSRAASSLASKSAHLQHLWTHILKSLADAKRLDCVIES